MEYSEITVDKIKLMKEFILPSWKYFRRLLRIFK
jgi:hypothetical protein